MFTSGDLVVGALSLLIAALAYALGRRDGERRCKKAAEMDAATFDRNMRHLLGA